jgi:hypothetical protein
MMKIGQMLLLFMMFMATLAGVLFFVFGHEDPAREGRRRAERDIADNRLFLRMYGRPTTELLDCVEILKTKYNITIQSQPYDVLTAEIVDEIEAYNGVMMQEIVRRYGPDLNVRLQQDLKDAISNGRQSRAKP